MSSRTSSSSDAFEISLEGKADVSVPAERAVLVIDVTTKGHNKQEVAGAVVSTARQMETLLTQLSQPAHNNPESSTEKPSIDHWTRTSLGESNHVPFDNETRKHLPCE